MASIIGKIVDQRNLQPIEGVGVKADGDGVEQKAMTGLDGKFQIEGLAAGQYEILAIKAGYEDGLYGPLWVFDEAPFELITALVPARDY